MSNRRVLILLTLTALACWQRTSAADDWPVFGRDHTHNAVSSEKGAPTDWGVQGAPKNVVGNKVTERHADAKNIKWAAQLGSQSLGGPVVSGGLVWVGTNNANPRDLADFRTRADGKKEPIDKSVLMCFRKSDGKFLWQYALPRIGGANMSEDWPYSSLSGAPMVEGDRLWLITNRCETVCFDIAPLRQGTGEPRELWKVDMRKDFGVVRHVAGMSGGFAASVPPPYKDRVYIATGNGMDDSRFKVPAPQAPSLVCFNKNTGKTLWIDNSPGRDIMRYQLSTPLVVEINGRGQVVHGQGDGWLRSFDALTGKLIWKCDLNAIGAKSDLPGRGTKANIVASPVYSDGRVYIATGWDAEYYSGVGWLYTLLG